MKIGTIVTYVCGTQEQHPNGTDEHPAIVTRVWSDDMVNLKVFFDYGDVETRGSVMSKSHPSHVEGSAFFKPHGI